MLKTFKKGPKELTFFKLNHSKVILLVQAAFSFRENVDLNT